MPTERHLLFAVMAFEHDLIDLAKLTAACRAWAGDKSKPLAELLVERGWLTEVDKAEVEKAVDRKLAKHQDDPRVTLNAITRGDVCDAIKEVEDSDIQNSLSSWPSAGAGASQKCSAQHTSFNATSSAHRIFWAELSNSRI